LKEFSGFLAGSQEFLHPLPQARLPGAGTIEIRRALAGGQSPSLAKNRHFTLERFAQGVRHHTVPHHAKTHAKRRKQFRGTLVETFCFYLVSARPPPPPVVLDKTLFMGKISFVDAKFT
jgi:hypothetical protein